MNAELPIRDEVTSYGRMVTLAFLSPVLPASFLSETLAQYLYAETGTMVLLVRLNDTNNTAHSRPPSPASPAFSGETPQPWSTNAGFYLLNLDVGEDSFSSGRVLTLLQDLRRHFDYVLVEAVTGELPAWPLFEFLLRSDTGYMFVEALNDDIYQLDLLMRDLRPHRTDSKVELKPVLCLREGGVVDGYDGLIQRVIGPLEVCLHDCRGSAGDRVAGSKLFYSDLRRLVRKICNSQVGLALSSGAAKGLSHIGVIQVLEENGIDVDIVAGSSMGAYVGAIWAYGYDGQKMEALAREMESRWSLWRLIDPVLLPRQGFIRGNGVKRRLMRSIGHVHFAELKRPFRAIGTNLETLERVVFSAGEVAEAVHASIAVPGICVPVNIGGETYVDGGIVDPLPVDVLREMGVSRIIAVNAIPAPDRNRDRLQTERELAQLPPKRAREVVQKWIPLGTHLNYFARGNILEILMRSIHGGQVWMAEALSRQADIVLRPEISDDYWVDFRDPGRFIEPGRRIAERYLDEIKALVARKVVHYEPTESIMVATA